MSSPTVEEKRLRDERIMQVIGRVPADDELVIHILAEAVWALHLRLKALEPD